MSGDLYYSKYLNSRFKAQQKKKLQSNLFGFKIQGSRLRKNFFNPTSLDSGFKAQKKLLQSNLFGFKIQDSRLRINFFNPTSWDSRFKIQGSEQTSSTPPVWIQDSRFMLKAIGFKKFFGDLESWILDPYPLGFKNLESYPLGFKKSFGDRESWIRCT